MKRAELADLIIELSELVEAAVELGDGVEADRLSRRLDALKLQLRSLIAEAA